jgi:hypothetical protein
MASHTSFNDVSAAPKIIAAAKAPRNTRIPAAIFNINKYVFIIHHSLLFRIKEKEFLK